MLSEVAQQTMLLSASVAGLAMIVALPAAVAVAHTIARRHFRGRGLLIVLVYLPLVLPPVVTGYLLLLGFGPNGPIGSMLNAVFGLELAFRWTGAALAAGTMAFPLMVRPMVIAFESIDPRLELLAETLGATKVRTFLTVTLPLAAPGVLAGLALGFAKAIGEFGATITFAANIPGETRTLALAVHTALQTPGGERTAVGLTALALALGATAVGVSEFAANRIRRGRDA